VVDASVVFVLGVVSLINSLTSGKKPGLLSACRHAAHSRIIRQQLATNAFVSAPRPRGARRGGVAGGRRRPHQPVWWIGAHLPLADLTPEWSPLATRAPCEVEPFFLRRVPTSSVHGRSAENVGRRPQRHMGMEQGAGMSGGTVRATAAISCLLRLASLFITPSLRGCATGCATAARARVPCGWWRRPGRPRGHPSDLRPRGC